LRTDTTLRVHSESKADATGECEDLRMARRPVLLLVLLLLLALPVAPGEPVAQEPRQIRVEVRFQQASQRGREAGVATERRVQRSSGLFTIVQDGGESVLTVATQVPVQQLAFYRDQATGAGYVASGVTFRDVGTTLRVQAAILPGDRIRVRMTPRISYLAAEGTGAVEFTEAAADLVVPNGRPVVLGGSTSETHSVLRQILGLGISTREVTETTVLLIASVR
jgi:Bacterial type II and III secretion system protein